jgi:hypothetical protein
MRSVRLYPVQVYIILPPPKARLQFDGRWKRPSFGRAFAGAGGGDRQPMSLSAAFYRGVFRVGRLALLVP